MTIFFFETMTQANADAITAGDIIAFTNTTVNARNVTVANSVQLGTDTTSLTATGKTLNFNAVTLGTLSEAGNLAFNDNSALQLGVNTGDTITGLTRPNTAYLFAGNDSYDGAAGSEDFVFGLGGNDTITGGSTASHLYGFNASGGSDGNDNITGGGAGDYLQGNSGNDSLDGGAGSDRLLGGANNDTITGGAGNDTANGNTGNDNIDGAGDDDFLRGGQGNDSITGGADEDTLLGDLGTDTLAGGASVDLVAGGAGNDQFNFGSATSVTEAGAVTPSGSTTAQYEAVADFENGLDLFQIRGSSNSTTAFGLASTDVVRGASDTVFAAGAVGSATVYAQQLLDGNSSVVDVAAVKVGTEVFLFWSSSATASGAIDNIVRLQGVSDVALITGGTGGDFV